MDYKKISTDKNLYKIIKELSFEELLKLPTSKEIRYLHQFSFTRVLKLITKRFLIDIINIFLKKKIHYDAERAVENVKAKYDKISGFFLSIEFIILNASDLNIKPFLTSLFA